MATAVLFPGQGSQFLGMADPWAGHPAGAEVLAEVSDFLGRDVVAEAHDEAALATTAFVQPALLACDVAAFRVLLAEGLSDIVGVAGHSLGEFAAVVAAGSMRLADAIAIVAIRGEAMQRAGEERAGAMTALLGLGAPEAAALCEEVRGNDILVVANENSPAQSVASGSVAAVGRLEALARERKIRAVRLPVAGAFHSELMRPAADPVRGALAAVALDDPAVPVAENVTGELVRDAARLRELLEVQVVSPVRWQTGIRSLADAGASTFLEAGSGDVLTKLMKRIAPDAAALAIGSPVDARSALEGSGSVGPISSPP
ncbi:MAG TPA: ACP S-malonyltransferase [Actinomycetota bacterium]|nr:ACP S-malonyltransferase [Actinomycetota bacterium]